MGLSDIENRLERLVSGAFGRLSRKGIQPSEIGKKLTREMELQKRIGVKGSIVPNIYLVALSIDDFEGLKDITTALHSELLNLVQENARTKHYKFVGFPKVTVESDNTLQRGVFAVETSFKEDTEYLGHLYIELPNGLRIPITREVVTIGRMPGSTVVIDDSRVSRRHLELKMTTDSLLSVKDLGSTNGTRINGRKIVQGILDEGDQLDIGGITIRVGRN